jgi:hypothetical protein
VTDLQKLLQIEEIKTLFARRLRYMDTRQWHLYAGLHTEDAVSETYSTRSEPVVGAEAIAAAIQHFMICGRAPIISVHHGHSPEIAFVSDEDATGIWAMEDHLWWQNDDRKEWLHGYGHYHEQYRRVAGRWLIAWRRLTRIRVDCSPGFYDVLAEG